PVWLGLSLVAFQHEEHQIRVLLRGKVDGPILYLVIAKAYFQTVVLDFVNTFQVRPLKFAFHNLQINHARRGRGIDNQGYFGDFLSQDVIPEKSKLIALEYKLHFSPVFFVRRFAVRLMASHLPAPSSLANS